MGKDQDLMRSGGPPPQHVGGIMRLLSRVHDAGRDVHDVPSHFRAPDAVADEAPVVENAPGAFRQHASVYLRTAFISGVGTVVARALGVLFSVVVARGYGPAGFGLVRYGISIAGLAAIVVGPLPTMLSRYLATYRHDPHEVDRYFTNALVLISSALVLTLLGIGWYLRGEPVGIVAGTLSVVLGVVVYTTYTELIRGLDDIRRMALCYVVANMVQLVAILICVCGLAIHFVGVALAIYGLSLVVPVMFFELRARTNVHVRWRLISRATLRSLMRFSVPLVVAHASYTVWISLDLLMIEWRLGPQSAGIYSAAKTPMVAFLFVPSAVTTVALRYFARGSRRDARRSLVLSLAASAISSLVLLLGFWGVGEPVLRFAFGRRYVGAVEPLLILAVGMAFYTLYLVFETWMVAKGYPWLHAAAMLVTMLVSTGLELTLLGRWGVLGVAAGSTVGIACGTFVLGGAFVWLAVRGNPLRRRSMAGSLTPGVAEARRVQVWADTDDFCMGSGIEGNK